jgi:hypothetical protein
MYLLVLLLLDAAHAVETYGDYDFYLGDLHAHTGYSGDAASADMGRCRVPGTCGNFADVFDEARDNGLDFLALSDHVNGFRSMSDVDWVTFHAAVLAAHDPANGFVTIPAGELWFYDGPYTSSAIGHKTLLMFDDNARLTPLKLDDVRPSSTGHMGSCEEVWTWADTLSGSYGELLLVPHHPATASPLWTEWSCHNDTYEPAVEIYSRHGNSLEGDSGYDIPGAGVVLTGYATYALDPDNFGLKMGFVGGTDAHDTHPGETCDTDDQQPTHLYGGGLTIAVLDTGETFDRPQIYDAIALHRTYTTTGPHFTPLLSWSVGEDSLGGLGTDFEISEEEELTITLQLPEEQSAYVNEVAVVGPDGSWVLDDLGGGVFETSLAGTDVPAWLYARIEIDGDAWYGTGACLDGGSDSLEYVWSSPSYIDVTGATSSTGGDTGDTGDAEDTGDTGVDEAGAGFTDDTGAGLTDDTGAGSADDTGVGFTDDTGVGFTDDTGASTSDDTGASFTDDTGAGTSDDTGAAFSGDTGAGASEPVHSPGDTGAATSGDTGTPAVESTPEDTATPEEDVTLTRPPRDGRPPRRPWRRPAAGDEDARPARAPRVPR